MDGKDRRSYKRLPIQLTIEVNEVFKQDHVQINNVGATIEVCDISKSGIGFYSEGVLPVDYYFQGCIELGDEEYFRAVIQIIRQQEISNNFYFYGAEFIGLAPFLASKVDLYEKQLHKVII